MKSTSSWIPDHLNKTGAVVPEEALWHTRDCVLETLTPHAFTQLTGYLRYARRTAGPVYYRGQHVIHDGLVPALMRDTDGNKKRAHCKQQAAIDRNRVIDKYLKKCKPGLLNDTPAYSWEPILQHYFLKTRWIDLVDNPWVALWFACHQATSRQGRYYEYHARLPLDHAETSRHWDAQQNGRTTSAIGFGHAYVVLLQPGVLKEIDDMPGLYDCGAKHQLIDLRVAAPSLYLRPHSQHGLLLRRAKTGETTSHDMRDAVVGVIAVRLDRALSWIGAGSLLNVQHLFPSPTHDEGFRMLLERLPVPPQEMGAIALVGA